MDNLEDNLENQEDASTERSVNFIARIGTACHRFSMKYTPDASVFTIGLTLAALLLGIALAKRTPLQMIEYWGQGFWELLTFAMQMSLIIITGSAVAHSPLMKRLIRWLAASPMTGRQAVWLISMISILISYLHWGLSLIIGALLAREMAKQLRLRKIPFEYSLIAAGGYLGLMTYPGMLSASVGLSIATPGHFLEAEMGIVPMSHYMDNFTNIFVTVAFLMLTPMIAALMHPADEDFAPMEGLTPMDPETLRLLDTEDVPIAKRPKNPSMGDRLTYSRTIAWCTGLLGMFYACHVFAKRGFTALDINMVNFIFMFLGILLYRDPASYVRAVRAAASGASGVILQFPFYAGIMGMIHYSGLVDILTAGIVSISNETTFYLWTFLSSSMINLFVPSGGGQWTLQGPAVVASAKLMDADLVKASLMVAYGDAWTNMIHPFWAIALLDLTDLKAKDIMGYTTAIMLCTGVVFLIAAFLPM